VRTLRSLVALVLGPLLVGCVVSEPSFETIDGRACDPLATAPGRASVLFFVTSDCPIANAYAPEIRSIAADYAASSALEFFLVHVDPEITPAAARAHAAEYDLDLDILLDRDHRLARALGITITPEAAVRTEGELAYRGRIDDRFVTPAPNGGILHGTTQLSLFEHLAEQGNETAYETVSVGMLASADAAWLLSSVRLAAPIRAIDDRQIAMDAALTASINSYLLSPRD